MNGRQLQGLLLDALPRLARSKDELRDLDAAIGDGDLGITVAQGCAASVDALRALRESCAPSEVLRAVAPAVARANPSTFAALVAAGLLAASRTLDDRTEIGPTEVRRIPVNVATRVVARGV